MPGEIRLQWWREVLGGVRTGEAGPVASALMATIVRYRLPLKIFEAMAMGKAVVSTTVGAEGLPVTDGRDIVLADDPDRFALAVVDLLRNPARREELERASRELMVTRYDWSVAGGELDDALRSVATLPAAGDRPLVSPRLSSPISADR